MIAALALTAAALASDAGELTTWSLSAVEAVPFLRGDVGLRAAQHLGLYAGLDEGGSFSADLSFRAPPGYDASPAFDLQQLLLVHRAEWGSLRVGRQSRLDLRGWLPIDGVSVDLRSSPFLEPSAFVGRLWSPEPGEDALQTWVGGVGLRLRPPVGGGEASRSVAFDLGWMERLSQAGLSHSLAAGASYRRPRGGSASLDGELRLGADPGSRAGVRATAFLGRHLALSPELRWEDLSPDAEISALRTPMDWLGGDGYAVASLAARVSLGGLELSLSGGPVAHQDETGLGALGRGGLSWRGEGLGVGVFGSGAAVDGSWISGGGLSGELEREHLSARAEAGSFWFQPLDGAAQPVVEGRGRLATPLTSSDQGGLALALDGAAGMGRLLAPWARATLSLEGTLGASP